MENYTADKPTLQLT